MTNDNIQHGIDGNPTGDAEKGAALGGLGGAVVGAAAGSLTGPIGAVIGAVAGGLIGAGASGAAVSAVDTVDNDDTVSGVGDGVTPTDTAYGSTGYSSDNVRASSDDSVIGSGSGGVGGHNIVTGEPSTSEAGNTGLAAGAITGGLIGTVVGGPVGAVVGGTLGSLVGGVAGDATEATVDEAPFGYDNNYAGSSFAPGVPFATDVTPLPPVVTSANDDVLAPSTQTDYRNVDTGVTSLGGSDVNADSTTLGGLGTPGVRTGADLPDESSHDTGAVPRNSTY